MSISFFLYFMSLLENDKFGFDLVYILMCCGHVGIVLALLLVVHCSSLATSLLIELS